MRNYKALLLLVALTCLLSGIRAAHADNSVGILARAGSVDGHPENSDAFIWQLFSNLVAPISDKAQSPSTFETWASDKDTFSASPRWPSPGEPIDLQRSTLAVLKMHSPDLAVSTMDFDGAVDEPCKPPPGAAVGGFPVAASPADCIAEQVARNRAQFDYIVSNKLNTARGRAEAYAKGVKIEMPIESIAVKGDWIPLSALLRWIPTIKDLAQARILYHTVTVKDEEYALVSMHVASRQNPNWVWGTFEHFMNPGRCDYIGCRDSFGSKQSEVPPSRTAFNTQYGECSKTAQLETLMSKARLPMVWRNYCLKSTQVDFVDSNATPYLLGNSVIEGIVGNGTVAASSCITCHYYASFGPNGVTTAAAKAILPFNPSGRPIPGVLVGATRFAFMWGVVLPSP